MEFVVFFCAVVIVKILVNASKLFEASRLRRIYEKSFTKDGKCFTEYVPRAKRLFVDAELSDSSIQVTESIGHGKIAAFSASIVENLDSRRADMVSAVARKFDELVGVYRMRLLDSFSPMYWIESIVFLPSRIAKYLGKKPDGLAAKLFQILYWIFTPILLLFRTELNDFVISLIKQFQQIP